MKLNKNLLTHAAIMVGLAGGSLGLSVAGHALFLNKKEKGVSFKEWFKKNRRGILECAAFSLTVGASCYYGINRGIKIGIQEGYNIGKKQGIAEFRFLTFEHFGEEKFVEMIKWIKENANEFMFDFEKVNKFLD